MSARTTTEWLGAFDGRTGQHGGIRAVGLAATEPGLRAVLGPSLATFQLGESGTGEHLFAAARKARADDGYLGALARFVAEEQEHARLLELVLIELDVPLRIHHWTDRVFVLVRRAHSLRSEILVLMVAEVIALSYYSALRDGIGDPALADAFGRIHDDEVVHVEFHCQTLPPHLDRFPPPVRAVAGWAWNLLVVGASVVVAVDHGRLLGRVELSRRQFMAQVWRDRQRVSARLFPRRRGPSRTSGGRRARR
ncbi:MAG: hypothetical protein JWO68_300 [Actinomycetia bacterium]|nr:hypothetical protein [Actinomycetes bacterium]